MISLGIWIFLKQTYKIMILGKPTEEELSKVVLRDTEFKNSEKAGKRGKEDVMGTSKQLCSCPIGLLK